MNTDLALSIDKRFFSEHTAYSEDVESGLKLIKPWSNHFNFKLKLGDTIGKKQYMRGDQPHCYRAAIKGKSYCIHRVIFVLFNGEIPKDHVVDHIDGNPFNNKIDNLRLLHTHLNTHNAKLRKDNSTGINGITVISNGTGKSYVCAQYKLNEKQVSKQWPLDSYSYLDALILAKEWREKEIAKQNLWYDPRHGL